MYSDFAKQLKISSFLLLTARCKHRIKQLSYKWVIAHQYNKNWYLKTFKIEIYRKSIHGRMYQYYLNNISNVSPGRQYICPLSFKFDWFSISTFDKKHFSNIQIYKCYIRPKNELDSDLNLTSLFKWYFQNISQNCDVIFVISGSESMHLDALSFYNKISIDKENMQCSCFSKLLLYYCIMFYSKICLEYLSCALHACLL